MAGDKRDTLEGGSLIFCHSRDAGDIRHRFEHKKNLGVAFELNDKSFHYVEEVRKGVRYTIVISFWTPEAGGFSPDSLVYAASDSNAADFRKQWQNGHIIPLMP